MQFPVAEKFTSVQGEGVYTGVVMSFIRLVGCSVGWKVCHACDTDFDKAYEHLGGGMFTVEQLVEWVKQSRVNHVCISGGEPLDRDIRPLLFALTSDTVTCHIETSGTKKPWWLDVTTRATIGWHDISTETENIVSALSVPLWITVSPKPGYLEPMLAIADEIKVIVGGLGDGPGWPGVAEATWWAAAYKTPVYLPKSGASGV